MYIFKIHFHALRNEAHYQFMLDTKNLIDNDGNVQPLINDLLPGFYNLIALEGTLVDAVKSSIFTQEMADADHRVDRVLVAISTAVNAALHHIDPAIVEAARHLKLRLNAFHGEIEKKSYKEEEAAVKILVNDLQTVYVSDVAFIGIASLVTELAAAQAVFEQLYNARNKELSERPQERLVTVRREVEVPYRAITGRIDAFAVVNGEYAYAPFIGQMNKNIAYFNEHAHHHGKKDVKNANVADIPPQPATGQEITPIPTVTLDEQQLVFTKDFNITFKNNINPGTATMTIHGKGADYKGQKEITFNII
ncbi:MAG: DUF6261 family protein [Prevotellaceae bacterium]|jgi:hypothetical protein|nr:DUF6261 family protein [Prevotellaceae bacterium]